MANEKIESKNKRKPLKKYKFKKWFYYLCKGFFAVCSILVPAKVINKQNIHKKGRYIYACNHLSFCDIPYTQLHMRGVRRYIGKKEFTDSFFYPLVASFGVIFVDRDKPEMSTLREVFGVLKEENGQILIFPEGTRNRGDYRQLQPIKHGLAMFAAKSEVPVIPMLIYRPYRIFHRQYIYIGEEVLLPPSGGRIPSASELAVMTEYLQYEMEKTRVYAEDYIVNKRWKKQNKLPAGEQPKLVTDWIEAKQAEKQKAVELISQEITENAGKD